MVDRRLSGQRLPVHVKPQPDELLSSWLTRLSLVHGTGLREFCNHLWPTLRLWGKDIDGHTDSDVLAVLAQKTATALPHVVATTYNAYEGQLFARFKPNGVTPWLLFNAMQRACRRLPALQYCPQCLRTDVDPYFRRHWRLGFITLCSVHRLQLRDRCPACRAPVNFHCLSYEAQTLAVCHQCRFDLRLANLPVIEDNPVPQRLVAFQTFLLQALATSGCQLPVHGVVPACDYFRVLHQLTRVLVTYRQAEHYRPRLCSHFGLPDFTPHFLSPRRCAVEVLSVEDRLQLMQLLACWLEEWPDQFVTACIDNWVWDTELLGCMPSPPPWYEQTARQVTWSNALSRVLQRWEHAILEWNPSEGTTRSSLPSLPQIPTSEIPPQSH